MKVSWLALTLLVGVAILVSANAHFIVCTQESLTRAAQACPAVPSDPATSTIAALKAQFDKAEKHLSLSISFYTLDRISDLILSLEAYAKAGDTSAYTATRALLLEALQNLARAEQVAWESVF